MTYEANGVEVTKSAFEMYERILKGERIEQGLSTEPDAAEELMHAGLIETQALVWETRVCYVLAGTDPRRDAVASMLRECDGPDGVTVDCDELADKILAVLR